MTSQIPNHHLSTAVYLPSFKKVVYVTSLLVLCKAVLKGKNQKTTLMLLLLKLRKLAYHELFVSIFIS